MTAMPMVCDISCGSQCHMKMQGFLFEGQEKLPKALKYKLISFFFFCSFSQTFMAFSTCFLGE